MHRTLHTIGYEGAELGDFVRTLEEAGVEQIIDIREVPISRKRGFSKKSLAAAVEERGLAYAHLRALGDPKAGREAMRRGDHEEFLAIFSKHMETEAAREALDAAVDLARARPSVLLCFERSPEHCHRTIVAAEMKLVEEFDVRDLGVRRQ